MVAHLTLSEHLAVYLGDDSSLGHSFFLFLFFLTAALYSILWLSHNEFPIDGHLNSFQNLIVTNCAVVNNLVTMDSYIYRINFYKWNCWIKECSFVVFDQYCQIDLHRSFVNLNLY